MMQPRPASKLDKHGSFIHDCHKKGMSLEEIAEAIKTRDPTIRSVSRGTVYYWLKNHPENVRSPLEGERLRVSPKDETRSVGGSPSLPHTGERVRVRGNENPVAETTEPEPAITPPASPDLEPLLARISELEDTLSTLREQKPAAAVPELTWHDAPVTYEAPPRVPSHSGFSENGRRARPWLGHAALLAVLGCVLFWLYSLVADNPLVSATLSFLASPVRSSQRIYTHLTASPVGMIITAVTLSGLALGFRLKTGVLVTLVWLMHLAMQRNDFITFTVLLFLSGRVTAAMLRGNPRH